MFPVDAPEKTCGKSAGENDQIFHDHKQFCHMSHFAMSCKFVWVGWQSPSPTPQGQLHLPDVPHRHRLPLSRQKLAKGLNMNVLLTSMHRNAY